MTVIKVKQSDDEVIIKAIRFIFTTVRRYVRVDTDTWYNKQLHQSITTEELETLSDKQLIWGKDGHADKDQQERA